MTASIGLEATRRTLAADQAAKVLILTTFDLDEHVYEAVRVRRQRLGSRGLRTAGFRPIRPGPFPILRSRGELYISETPLKTHITHIVQKLNPATRVQAVVLAHETGLLDADARP